MEVIDNVIEESMSPQHLKVMKALVEPKKDLDLAQELGLEDTRVRIILNDLHERKLVCYTKTKNKNTGWVTHYWMKREDQLENYTKGYIAGKIKNINHFLSKDSNDMSFRCECKTVDYGKAIEEGFSCIECGKPYMEYHDPRKIDEQVIELTRLNSMLKSLT
ncbi:MAG TPA: hypothetical protein ENN13_01670 [Candidatus Altiarchaeales archaeon]|nr:hypothetical protein [Candidatus Altiarchaeales archaeon]